jgi:hypothetical protein
MATPRAWEGSNPTTAMFFRDTDVEVQVVGTPGADYTPQRSLDGTTFVACNAYDKDGNIVTAISAAGIYSIDGAAYLKFTGGSGSTFTVRSGE